MNGQQRLLIIFLRLMSGKTVNKFEMMEKFDKKESSIQRDIVKIEEIITDEIYSMVLKEKMSIERDGKGNYRLIKEDGHPISNRLSDTELLMVLKILMSTRVMTRDEMDHITSKIVNRGEESKNLRKAISNELLHYYPISEDNLTEKIDILNNAVEMHQMVEFDYTKNDETRIFQRVPTSIYFSDLYFFMISSSITAKDDRDFENLNKFRINNMKNIRVISSNNKIKYSEKFEGGLLRSQTHLPFLGNPIKMIIDFYYDPVYVLDRFPTSKIQTKNEDGSYRIEMHVNDGYGTKMWLTSQSHMVKVVSPKHMRDYVVSEMITTLKMYDIEIP